MKPLVRGCVGPSDIIGISLDGEGTIRSDVVLIDPQYAPKVLKDPDAEPMVELIRTIAREEGVPVFRRWAQMKEWREDRHIPFETFLSPDLFHMNDWSYSCWAEALSGAISAAATQSGFQFASQPAYRP